MQFALSEEQTLLQETARAFVDRHCPPALAKEWDETDHFPVPLWRRMAEMGWFALPFPEAWGGGGGSPLEICLIAEALARASLDVAMAYVGTFIPGLTIYRHGTDEQRERFKPGLLDGEYRIAVAISEPDAGSDAAALRCAATDAGDHFVVNGQKAWCTGAGLPGALIAAYVRTDPAAPKHRGISLLLIPNDSPGVQIRRTPTLARHLLGTNEVFFDNVQVPKENLIGPLNGAFSLTMDELLAYTKQRTQFDRPIGNFQALAHPMADLQTEIDAARLLAYRAAWMISAGQPCTREAAMAKLKCSETYVAAARLGMQVLAGHGFATESVMSFRWRESIVATISGGTSQIQRNAVAKSMGLTTY